MFDTSISNMTTTSRSNLTRYPFVILLIAATLWNCTNKRYEEAKNMGGIGMPRGLIQSSAGATPGYVFFTPLLSSTTYLVNTEGKVVHQWESQYGPAGFVYLKDNGNLLRGARDPDAPVFSGGGMGGRIQEFTWDGDLVWDFKFANASHMAHHDVAILPNGNVLAIAWEAKSVEEAMKAGRKPEWIPKAGVWPDMIVELQPQGKSDAEVVWEWHIWDHLIQDVDEKQDNFGKVEEHPELIDINIGGSVPRPVTQEEINKQLADNQAATNATPDNQGSDLFHTNAIDYNAELDQIIISSAHHSEILIIDHSTTTEEAAGHSGGRRGKGGDFLYRWGNPKNYHRGDSSTQILGGQHDARWVPKGYPGEGHVMVFDNNMHGPRGPFTAILEIAPPLLDSAYALEDDKPYGPATSFWHYVANDSTSFHSPFISGAHRMTNGNTFITEGPKGRFFEVTNDGKIVWEYWTPFAGYAKMPDGTFPQPVGPLLYATFRATHITMDHPAVKGKSLAPLSPQPEIYKVQ